jgi:ATP-dependent protease Clp ATPase subunit
MASASTSAAWAKVNSPFRKLTWVSSVTDDRCSFCGHEGERVRPLAHGPRASICPQCLDLCREVLTGEVHSGDPHKSCAFCLQLGGPDRRLLAGPAIYICQSCVARLTNAPIS